jgi:uncharacterized integral membrane protein
MRFAYWGLTLLAAIICAVFAAYNRASTVLDLWPFATVELPLYLLVLGTLMAGFLLGSLVTWFGHFGVRRERRRLTKQVQRLDTPSTRPDEPPPPGRSIAT